MSEELTKHTLTVKLSYDDKIIEKDGNARIYRDATLLTPGAWSDSTGMSAIEYTEEELKKSASNWESNYLNVDHNWGVLSRIGRVENTHWNKAVKGDTIALIDGGLVNELSVELMSRDVWKAEDEKRYATDISFVGLAVVTLGACSETSILP